MADESLIADRFELIEKTASGGMGTVYRGVDRITGTPVAIKIMKTDAGIEASRFNREAKLLEELTHPAIVRFVAHGASDGGRHYIVSEWLDGVTLKDKLATDGMTTQEAVAMALHTAEAIAEAHEMGIIHRDIKPSNIFLEAADPARVKVLDFGIARHLQEELQLTMTGTMIGTPGYMSPEQARGQQVDKRADVWSLGCILYESLTGHAPFAGKTPMAVRLKVLMTDPVPLHELCSDAPLELVRLVERMLSKDVAQRPATAGEVVRELSVFSSVGDGTKRRRVDNFFAADLPTSTLATAEPTTGVAGSRSGSSSTGSQAARTGNRLHSVVLVSSDSSDSPEVTDRLESAARDGVSSLGGDYQIVDKGSVACRLSSTDARQCAAQAARLALQLREVLKDASIVVSSNWETPDQNFKPLDYSIEWCAENLESAALDNIFADFATQGGGERDVVLDRLTADLLDESFRVEQTMVGFVLRPTDV